MHGSDLECVPVHMVMTFTVTVRMVMTFSFTVYHVMTLIVTVHMVVTLLGGDLAWCMFVLTAYRMDWFVSASSLPRLSECFIS